MIHTPARGLEGEVLALIVNGKSVQSASFGDQVEVILPKTGFYVEAGGQVDDTGYIKSLPLNSKNLGGVGGGQNWEIEVTSMVGLRLESLFTSVK